MTLIITALAAGQISYENALALAIGANIGTTITAIIGSLTANFQGKRLALAHLIFNVVTAGVALIFIGPIRVSGRFRLRRRRHSRQRLRAEARGVPHHLQRARRGDHAAAAEAA